MWSDWVGEAGEGGASVIRVSREERIGVLVSCVYYNEN